MHAAVRAQSCKSHMADALVLARTFMPAAACWRLLRHLNAAHVLAYVALNGGAVYGRSNLFLDFNQKHQLLTPHEVDRLDELDVEKGGECVSERLSAPDV